MSFVTARSSCALSFLAALLLLAAPSQAQWINELHYDNTGGDVGEAVEVVLPSAADAADFDLYLYNGNGGAVYDGPLNLGTDFTEGDTDGDFTVYSLAVVVQNGDPDGLALTEGGVVVPGQFLSYEGTFTATDGPADGLTSTDIGVAEGGGTAAGESLQLVGQGLAYADFAWQAPAGDSFGSVNSGQTFAPPSTDPIVRFTASAGTAEEGESIDLSVEIDYPDDAPDGADVTVEVALDALASTADAADFDGATTATLTFDGDTDNETLSATFTLADDADVEGDEEAVFGLAVTSGEAMVMPPSTFTLTINDEDTPDLARVQIIHNAPDPAADTVDVLIAGLALPPTQTLFNDVPFRGATAFFDLNPGDYTVSVSAQDGTELIFEELTLESGESYQLIASGVADPSQFQPNPNGQDIAAELFVNAMARETSDGPGEVRFNIVHGSTDGPRFDLFVDDLQLANDLTYGVVTAYAGVPADEYILEVQNANGTQVLGAFFAPFSGFGGQAVSVLASGFVTPGNEDDTNGTPPSFGLLLVFPDGNTALLAQSLGEVDIATARNAPLLSLVTVEGTVTRALGDFTRIQDATGGLTIRQTSGPFMEDVNDGTITTGTVLRVTGLTSEFASLFQLNEQLGSEDDYELLGTDDLPAVEIVTLAEIAAGGEMFESQLVQLVNLNILGDGDTEFQPSTTYQISDASLSDGSVTLRVPNADDTDIDGTPIPLARFDYTGVLGQFDFDDPDAGYQLNPVQATDVVAQDQVSARLQIIHNAPDPAFDEVDIYVNGDLFEDDLAFRTGTPFAVVPAGVKLEVAVAPGTSSSAGEAIFTETYTLLTEINYQLIATGVGDGSFEANPDGNDIAFTLVVNDMAQLESDTDDTNSDLNFVHGTPDAPAVDVRTGVTQDIVIFDDVAFGGQDGYQPFAPELQMLEVTTADGVTSVALFEVDFSGRIDEAGTVLASGFLTPENEDDTNGTPPGFGLLVVFADGSALFAEPASVSAEDGTALPTAFALQGTYPNPFATQMTVRYDLPADARVGLEVYDTLGRRVLALAPQPVAAGRGRTLTVDAALPSGVYLYRLSAETATETTVETGRVTVVR
ncbi:MAG: DUF4397 domain-containing protein [Bacteroidota bacterium]